MKPEDLAREQRSIEREAARALRSSGLVLPAGTKQLAALPVRTQQAMLESWFVPLVAQDVKQERLVAYLRFTPGHVLRGISSFLSQPSRLDSCPLAADWLDEHRIAARAQALGAPGEHAGAPMLSFDGVPDRLAWAVPLQGPGAASRWVFVAGTSAWPDRPH